ncbi:peptide/nickel transport system substrate-binding protein [Murinocardiopsis flavida]|uniref:Peptide/nickel transport system substrate-binding protein n=1 Tax=Murinocardiopsis flavida TaxID=645275 RepID=A0A2P8DF83_9ACTN|nr:ABC transporter substrate-binding protein [Murinocardiopsis flavida]PSK95868.1 peptide/nickel transport system substrate-binding protein [Murinocardiopsis flavida]
MRESAAHTSAPSTASGPVRAISAALLAVAALTACSPLVDPKEVAQEERSVVDAPLRDGGELVIGLDAEPDALDPSLSTTLVGRQIFSAMCEKLYDVDRDLRVVPQLAAAAPELSDDGLTLTIPLRDDGVLFNDGTPFDAGAVAQSLRRHIELPGSVRGTELDAVEKVEAAGDDTVVLRLSRPDAGLPATLADRAGMVMSPAALDEHGADFARDPVCVGPFDYTERVAQDRVVLDRSDHYYGADEVRLDRVVYKGIPDDNIRLANLRSGQLDLVMEVGPNDVAQVADEAGLELLNQPSLQYMGMTVNIANADGVGKKPRQVEGALAEHDELRTAMSLALDRETINEVVFSGVYQPACGPIPPISPYATEATLACPDFDPDRARALVEESGVDTPVPVEVMIPNDPTNLLLGQVIQAMAGDVGFDVTLRPTEFASSVAAGQAGDFEAYVQGWSGRVDPNGNIGQFFVTGGGNNYSGTDDPEVNALIEDAAAETDPDRRGDLYDELVPELRERNSIIYLYRNRIYNAHRSDVAGIEVYPDGLMRVGRAGHVAEGG